VKTSFCNICLKKPHYSLLSVPLSRDVSDAIPILPARPNFHVSLYTGLFGPVTPRKQGQTGPQALIASINGMTPMMLIIRRRL
jgi:hypothetical protein